MERGARVVFIPPPLYYGLGFAAGMLLDARSPAHFGGTATLVAGIVVGVVGLALGVAGVAAVVGHHTTIVPHHPVSALLTTGVYRISRNPMYTGLGLVYLGGTLLAGSWWPLLFLPIVLGGVRRLVIAPEEAYLSEAFGVAYATYRTRTRRWL
jgi:protein-S-isoprenylcysteine O-methyltransferase Ste14